MIWHACTSTETPGTGVAFYTSTKNKKSEHFAQAGIRTQDLQLLVRPGLQRSLAGQPEAAQCPVCSLLSVLSWRVDHYTTRASMLSKPYLTTTSIEVLKVMPHPPHS